MNHRSQNHRRKKPYSENGIHRVPCCRCGKPSSQQWQICSDDNVWRAICTECDIQLNRIVLLFMGFPTREVVRKMRKYTKKMEEV